MALPASFKTAGFLDSQASRLVATKPGTPNRKFKRLMIGSDGEANTGKSEFAMSAPGPGLFVCLDRGFDAMLDNPRPPEARGKEWGFKVVTAPLASTTDQNTYAEYWKSFRTTFYSGLDNPEARTVVLDGDSDSWELQRLGSFGKLTQIPSIMYTNVNAERRAFIARAYDSGKIIIATNKVKPEYVDDFNIDGSAKLDNAGKQLRKRSGEMERQGFNDHEYLWAIQIRHLYKAASFNKITKREVPQQWGIRIMMCKADRSLEGSELWGPDCNFAGLVQTVYPHIALEEWGF